jgi:hypothetical protein
MGTGRCPIYLQPAVVEVVLGGCINILLFVAFVAIAAAADEVNAKVSAVRESPPSSSRSLQRSARKRLGSAAYEPMAYPGGGLSSAGLCVLSVGLQHRQPLHDRRRVPW